MRISEIFRSFQGEGCLAGTPSVFVRTGVCNLRCVWCDTRYTSWEPQWADRTVESIETEVLRLAADEKISHVVITGGEPTLEPEHLTDLCVRLSPRFHITIETNATKFLPVEAHLISMSPKLANSTPPAVSDAARAHDSARISADVIRSFLRACDGSASRDCQVKFVIEQESDLEEVRDLEHAIPIPREKILLMPQSVEPADCIRKSAWLRELAARSGYGFSPRLHIERFGNRRGV